MTANDLNIRLNLTPGSHTFELLATVPGGGGSILRGQINWHSGRVITGRILKSLGDEHRDSEPLTIRSGDPALPRSVRTDLAEFVRWVGRHSGNGGLTVFDEMQVR